MCRRDTQETNLIDMWDDGMKDADSGTSGNTRGVINLNATPFNSSELCSKFKILKKTVIQLAAGQSHIHKVNIRANRLINRDMVDDYNFYRGVSFLTIAVLHGMPYNDSTDKQLVCVGDAHVDWVKSERHMFRFVKDQETTFGYSKGQQAITAEQIMSSKTGGVVIDTDA